MKEQMRRRIEATEMDAIRRASRTSRRERIPNEIIKENMGVKETVTELIERKQLVWYGHVQRMAEHRLPKKVMRWIPPEHRKRGRPKKTWIEGVRKSMSERGLDDEACNDRRHWQMGIGQRRRAF
ncbi:uncharacterized protein LOC123321077 [Coccinella septempunctata]|uniref:uncharacterized protein LOC123321077 n=1 Tax=Coccinella septempunctata TaxID=41139 RepID=UPI001D0894C6|nr:uncharacterized protein LOC123321077 [Coccinella septempunctata]